MLIKVQFVGDPNEVRLAVMEDSRPKHGGVRFVFLIHSACMACDLCEDSHNAKQASVAQRKQTSVVQRKQTSVAQRKQTR